MTLPGDDNGYRVLPAAAYMDLTERMWDLSGEFTPLSRLWRASPETTMVYTHPLEDVKRQQSRT